LSDRLIIEYTRNEIKIILNAIEKLNSNLNLNNNNTDAEKEKQNSINSDEDSEKEVLKKRRRKRNIEESAEKEESKKLKKYENYENFENKTNIDLISEEPLINITNEDEIYDEINLYEKQSKLAINYDTTTIETKEITTTTKKIKKKRQLKEQTEKNDINTQINEK
jgi:hypothetical protein